MWAFLADGALVKRFHPGKAAETGVSAALLAQSGLTGPGQILEAEWGGFYPTYAAGHATPERAIAGLGQDFHILRSGIKPHACCRTLHSAVDAALRIMRERGGDSTAIRSMVVHGNAQTQRQFSRMDIRNLLEAQFSAPYCSWRWPRRAAAVPWTSSSRCAPAIPRSGASWLDRNPRRPCPDARGLSSLGNRVRRWRAPPPGCSPCQGRA